ncbi:helix-turn-helix transcriptional regulator [Sporosarcina sp. GW1-11]|uniref:helix-turn-helix transcriptional regulator n=1 Tax=Sporosarcina sp. GW1-11 TaxID=2899126 RepID=UPI00294C4F8B|nr:helix-turn-helix transcriptional regulator [Sporosarcina sp. GW1-11]MDV6378745.1 helix-turn-helix transcriptional regulator [Sporosarcina sp. GW1-11]
MKILLLIKDPLEAQGLQWLLTSQWNDVTVEVTDDVSVLRNFSDAYLYIIDMDFIKKEAVELPAQTIWLGISSERTFQTVYQALTLKAEDVLFRPFPPERLLKQIQQIRFRWRNENVDKVQPTPMEKQTISSEDLLIRDTLPEHPICMSLLAISDLEALHTVVDKLKRYDFPSAFQVFPFSDHVLVIHRLREMHSLHEAYRVFFSQWKLQSDALLTIYLYKEEQVSYRLLYSKMRLFHERIFYDGYDILMQIEEDFQWKELDPFLSPIDQQKWIEMLNKQQLQSIREWLEYDFLTLEQPYPNPEMVRVRLTSILAQMRRYMMANSLQTSKVEQAYHALFNQTIQEPVMYHIIQSFISFSGELIRTSSDLHISQDFAEKVRERMVMNYWNSSWNLADCAEEMKMHKSTLSRKYAKEADESFRDALLNIRIEQAKRLLKETDLAIADVAETAGFSHPAYFSKRFKEATGWTPYAYRQS